MRFGKSILILTIGAALSFGCEPDAPAPAPADTAPANTAEASSLPAAAQHPIDAPAAATQPTVFMLIEGEQKAFPASRLVVDDRNGKTVALLMSDDPPAALNDDYAGNSYYMEMEFDDLLPTIRGQVWEYEAPDSEKQDTPNGIFLQGNRWQLQPFQVRVQFQQVDGADVAWISGTFSMYQEGERPPLPRVVSVTGRVPVTLPSTGP